MPDDTFPGWCCLWESHPGGVGVPCRKVGGVEMCEACWRKHAEAEAKAAESRKETP